MATSPHHPTAMIRIAIIENDEDVSESYETLLKAAWGDAVEIDLLYNLDQAQRRLREKVNYDLISLDLHLAETWPAHPTDLEGLRLLADMDRDMRSTVLVVSSATTLVDEYLQLLKVRDVLQKPHSLQDYLKAVRLGLEVQGKIPAGKGALSSTSITLGQLTIDPLKGYPTWKGIELVGCTLTHQRILYKIVANAPSSVPVKGLLEVLPAVTPSRESLNTHISEIRKIFRAVGETSEIIRTEAGSYRWTGT